MQNWNWFVLFLFGRKRKSNFCHRFLFRSAFWREKRNKGRVMRVIRRSCSDLHFRSFHPVSSLSMLLQSCWQVQTLTITPVWPFTRPFWPFHIITKLDFRLIDFSFFMLDWPFDHICLPFRVPHIILPRNLKLSNYIFPLITLARRNLRAFTSGISLKKISGKS